MHACINIGWNRPDWSSPRGNCYIITLVDYFSKWPEAESIADKTARTVAEFLYKIIYACRQMYMIYLHTSK